MIDKDFFWTVFPLKSSNGCWQIPSRERVLQGLQLVTITETLGEIAHSDVKGNVSPTWAIKSPKSLLTKSDAAASCSNIFFIKKVAKETAHFFVLSLWFPLRPSYLTLLAAVGFLVVFANPGEAKLPSHQTQSRQCLFQLYYSPIYNYQGCPDQELDHRWSPTKLHFTHPKLQTRFYHCRTFSALTGQCTPWVPKSRKSVHLSLSLSWCQCQLYSHPIETVDSKKLTGFRDPFWANLLCEFMKSDPPRDLPGAITV